MNQANRLVALALTSAQTLLIVSSAHAQCLRPMMKVIWSAPSDGATDVSTNAALWLITTLPLSTSWQTTIDGRMVTPNADGAFPLGDLQPDTDHIFRVRGAEPTTPGAPSEIDIHFRTASNRAAAGEAPRIISTAEATRAPELSGQCAAVYSASCRDTVGFPIRRFELQADDAVAWRVTSELNDVPELWPAECEPHIAAPKADECYQLQAVYADGSISDPTRYCPGDMVGSSQ